MSDEPYLEVIIEQSTTNIAEKLPKGRQAAIVAFESPHENLSGYVMDVIVGMLR